MIRRAWLPGCQGSGDSGNQPTGQRPGHGQRGDQPETKQAGLGHGVPVAVGAGVPGRREHPSRRHAQLRRCGGFVSISLGMIVQGSAGQFGMPVVVSRCSSGNQRVTVRQLVHPGDAHGNQKAEQYQRTAAAAKRCDDHLLVSTHLLNPRPSSCGSHRSVGRNHSSRPQAPTRRHRSARHPWHRSSSDAQV